MASKILFGHQTNYDKVRQRAIVYSIDVLNCNVCWQSEVLYLDFSIMYSNILIEQQFANRQFCHII